jgi:hypothetical protein
MILRYIAPFLAAVAWADGPKDNLADQVRPIPPPGVAVPEADRKLLQQGLTELRTAIDVAVKAQQKNPKLADLLPDIEVYYKAVDWALKYNEVHKLGELKSAQEILAEGMQRAGQLKNGQHPWTTQKGLVVRGYRSKIDGSVQPYGMVIPETYQGAPARLDAWCHGRGETLSELAFIDQRRKQTGQISPANTLVLHPYGRYCCANKFAGEIDLMEALGHAKRFYAIDEDRMIIRGFSMGGAAVWQFAVNYPDLWCAANPGAGFAETPEFLNVFQSEDVSQIPAYEKTLWHWYNATDRAVNLFHVPTVAYSGELDKQKQAADVMARHLREERIELTHIIGPQTAHKIHPDSLIEIEKRLAAIASLGRDRTPREIQFTTWFLRYPTMHWLTVDRMERHWERARVHAKITSSSALNIETSNVRGLTLDMPAGHAPFPIQQRVVLKIDRDTLELAGPKSDRSWQIHLRRQGNQWQQVDSPDEGGQLAKIHGLSGPIDDAFMDSFLMVKPTGGAMNPELQAWTQHEMNRAFFEWRRQFRGDAPVKDDQSITDADIAAHHLVLWGDPKSNAVLAKVLAKLPITWADGKVTANGKTYDVSKYVPILIYPNPLNPKRYVVINSSFTYREYDYLNNARQVAKLPDWAVVEITAPKSSRGPGKISDAGFFDELWQWRKN